MIFSFTVTAITCAALAPDLQDTTVVRIDNSPQWGENVTLVEELRIGTMDGSDEYVLGQPETITVDRAGNIYVVDGQVPIIRQYDSLGQHIKDLGRGGDGPGEYQQIIGMHAFDDGRLLVWDANARATLFSAAGSYLEGHAFHGIGAAVGGEIHFVVDTAGRPHAELRDRSREPHPQMWGGYEWPMTLFRIRQTGEADKSFEVPFERSASLPLHVLTNDGLRLNFVEQTLSAFSNRGYLVTGHNSTYELQLIFENGSVRTLVRDRDDTVRLTRGEAAMWEARFRSMERRTPPRQREGYAGFADLPRTKPVFRGLSVDADGRIWVERYVPAVIWDVEPRDSPDGWPARTWREPTTYDVVQPDGVFLGTVVLPSHTIAMFQKGIHLWGIRFGDHSEPYVVRFRLEPNGM